jgi:hypothetical protein
MEAAKAPPTFTDEDAFYLAEELASRGTEGLRTAPTFKPSRWTPPVPYSFPMAACTPP